MEDCGPRGGVVIDDLGVVIFRAGEVVLLPILRVFHKKIRADGGDQEKS
jgi:hypothetical protein